MVERKVLTKNKAKKKRKEKEDLVNDGDKVWVTVTRTADIGKYESYKLEAGLSKTYGENDDPMDIIEELEDQLSGFVLDKTEEVKEEYQDE
ncbi:MAG: hypothetical protein ACOC2U_00170 [bacterium]